MKGPKLVVFRGKDRQWWWRVQTGNNRIAAVSGEGFKRRAGALNGAWAVLNLGGAGFPLEYNQRTGVTEIRLEVRGWRLLTTDAEDKE